MRGYLAASILAQIEQLIDQASGVARPLGQRFDLLSGTSAGGLIAIGLALGRTALELQQWFASFASQVFAANNRRATLRQPFAPRYLPTLLCDVLSDLFGTHTLADVRTDLCVTSISLENARPRLHKTDYFARNAARLDERLFDIALATTAAPTYFPAHSTKYSEGLIDGGLAANNPSLIALIDALQFERPSKRGTPVPVHSFTAPAQNPVLLSIGTGSPGQMPFDSKALTNGGWWNWKKAIYEVMFLSQASMTHDQAGFLLRDHYLRINPLLHGPIELDDGEAFVSLRSYADLTRESEKFVLQYLT